MTELNLKWSKNNAKLEKLHTISFNLPAFRSADGFKVCPQAGACATLCYARQGRYTTSRPIQAREFNLNIVRTDLIKFKEFAIQDLSRMKTRKTVRVHDSGDFFSQDYLDSWFEIARTFPDKKFYAYTKSIHLDRSKTPSNFQIVQSVGGLLDRLIDTTQSHSRIFVSHKDRVKAGYVNGNINDGPAIKGITKIGLVYHGVKNLKKGQIAWLQSVG